MVIVIVFGVNSIFRAIVFSREVLLNWLDMRPRSEEVLVKANLLYCCHCCYCYLGRTSDGEEMESLFVSAPKEKFILQQEKKYQGLFEPQKYL